MPCRNATPATTLLAARPWINAWKMTLDQARWEAEGTLRPTITGRPLRPMGDNFTGIFAVQGAREKVLYRAALPHDAVGQGVAVLKVVPIIHRALFVNKPAMRAHRILVKD